MGLFIPSYGMVLLRCNGFIWYIFVFAGSILKAENVYAEKRMQTIAVNGSFATSVIKLMQQQRYNVLCYHHGISFYSLYILFYFQDKKHLLYNVHDMQVHCLMMAFPMQIWTNIGKYISTTLPEQSSQYGYAIITNTTSSSYVHKCAIWDPTCVICWYVWNQGSLSLILFM